MTLGIQRVMLKLEAIGDDIHACKKHVRRGDIDPETRRRFGAVKEMRSQAWVARLTGLDPQYRFKREFVRGQKDYSQANSVGSRGVYIYYALPSGIYEVNAPLSWTKTDRYYCRVVGQTLTRLNYEEVICLLASAN